MQNYVEKRPIPNNPGNSYSTYCDEIMDMRHSGHKRTNLVAKVLIKFGCIKK